MTAPLFLYPGRTREDAFSFSRPESSDEQSEGRGEKKAHEAYQREQWCHQRARRIEGTRRIHSQTRRTLQKAHGMKKSLNELLPVLVYLLNKAEYIA